MRPLPLCCASAAAELGRVKHDPEEEGERGPGGVRLAVVATLFQRGCDEAVPQELSQSGWM